MMELVNFVAGVGCGVLAGVIVSLLLLIWQANAEAMQAIRREQLKPPPLVIVEQPRRMLGDGKRR